MAGLCGLSGVQRRQWTHRYRHCHYARDTAPDGVLAQFRTGNVRLETDVAVQQTRRAENTAVYTASRSTKGESFHQERFPLVLLGTNLQIALVAKPTRYL